MKLLSGAQTYRGQNWADNQQAQPSARKTLRKSVRYSRTATSSNRAPLWKVYGNVRTLRFNELGHSVPAQDGISTLKKICETIRDNHINLMLPIEFRYVRADNSMIGMFSQRDSATISAHQYIKQEAAPLFNAVEPLLQEAGGRPHWGKTINTDRWH